MDLPSILQVTLFQNYTLMAKAFATVLLILVCFFISFKKSAKQTSNRRVAPPEADGGWPVIGHFRLFGGATPDEPAHVALGSMAEKYGPIFTVRLGVHRGLVVSSSEVAKEIFTTHDLAVSTRPKIKATTHMTRNFAMFGFTPYGPYWREMRKMVSLNLLSHRRLDLLKHVPASELRASIKELYRVWMEKKDENGQVLVEIKEWFGEMSFNTVLQMVAGKRYMGSTDPKEDEEARYCRNVMREFFRLIGTVVVADILPFLGWLDWGGYEKAMKKTAREMDSIVQGWLDEHLQKRESGKGIDDDEQDFMDMMLSTIKSDGLFGFDANTIVKATCQDLIASSSDTITTMLTWVLALLLNNHDALKKVHEELELHVGKEREVTESDINNLVYLQAVIKETFRLYPLAPLGGARVFTEDCVVAGYHVPKGTRLIVNIWKLHQDPETWSEPSRFMPERFLGPDKCFEFKGKDYDYLPFGGGRRYCPGMNLGLQMLHLVTAGLLHGFDIDTPDNAPVDMTGSPGLVNAKSTPFKVLLTPRLSPSLMGSN